MAILIYLAVTGQIQRRDTLAALFWPESGSQAARAALRRELHTLTSKIGNDWLTTSRDEIALAPDADVWVDAAAFRQALASSQAHDHSDKQECDECFNALTAAAALYQGDFLAGFTLSDCPEFDDWQFFEADSLRREFAQVLERLVQLHKGCGEFEAAIDYARRWLSLDPLHEPVHRQLMALYALAGQQAAAVRQYDECVRILDHELGVSPEEETAELFEAIRTRQYPGNLLDKATVKKERLTTAPKAGAGHTTVPASEPITSIPLVDWGGAPEIGLFYGRQEELAHLHDWLLRDRSRLVAVLGMGGIGKTSLVIRLVQTLEQLAHDKPIDSSSSDHEVTTERAETGFQRIIWRSLLNAPPLNDILHQWLQTLSAQQVTKMPDTLDQSLSLLLDYLREQRCLLILDNMESILQGDDLLAGQFRPGHEEYGQLLQRLGANEHKSCLLLTSRERPHGLRRLESDLPLVRSLQLNGLSTATGQDFLTGRGLSDSEVVLAQLVERYSGNPLALKLIAETIQDLFAGNVEFFLADETLIFDDIRTVLDQQFTRLSALEREILVWLMLEREAITVERLYANLAQPPTRRVFLEALRSLERRSLLNKSRDRSGVRFTLQNVVTEYVTDHFVEEICREFEDKEFGDFNRHALIKAQAEDYVRESQSRLILQPIVERLAASRSGLSLADRLRRLLATLHNTRVPHRDYAAGNILNLLIHLKSDLRSLDFSHLAVWQAYLAGINLPDVNFAQSDLSGTVFGDTFGSVYSVSFSPDGKLLAMGTLDGQIRLWQVADGQPFFRSSIYTSAVRSVAFSPDGRTLASGSDYRTIRLWDVASRQSRQVLSGHTDRVRSVCFSPAGHHLASGGDDQTVRLWDIATGQCLRTLSGHTDRVWSVAFSPDGQVVASGSDDQTIRLWDAATGQCLLTLAGHTDVVQSVAFSPDGQLVASGSDDQTIRLWDVATGQCYRIIAGHSNQIISVAFSPDGQSLVSGGDDHTVRLWDMATGHCRQTFTGHTNWVLSVAIGPDGDIVASGGDDQTVRLWDVATGQCRHTFSGHTSWVRTAAFSRDGKTLAGGSNDLTVRLWDVATGQCRLTLRGHTNWIGSVTFSPNGKTVASGSFDCTIRLWDTVTGECLHILSGHADRIRSVAFSPNGQVLASGSFDQTVRLWDVATGQECRQFMGHTKWVRSVAFSPDGRTLATAGDDQTVRLWDVHTGRCLQTLSRHTNRVRSVTFSPDGMIVASAGDDLTVQLSDAVTGQCLHTLRGHTNRVRSVAFSPDGHILASGSNDQTVRLWDVATGEFRQTLSGHAHMVLSVAFGADADTLATGSRDGTMKLWDIRSGDCLKTLRNERPYEQMNITGATGISDAQRETLKVLGAIEDTQHKPSVSEPTLA